VVFVQQIEEDVPHDRFRVRYDPSKITQEAILQSIASHPEKFTGKIIPPP
jgi:hypothetical protein